MNVSVLWCVFVTVSTRSEELPLIVHYFDPVRFVVCIVICHSTLCYCFPSKPIFQMLQFLVIRLDCQMMVFVINVVVEFVEN